MSETATAMAMALREGEEERRRRRIALASAARAMNEWFKRDEIYRPATRIVLPPNAEDDFKRLAPGVPYTINRPLPLDEDQ